MFSLPPGYVLKSEQKAAEENSDDGPTIEEQIEEERKKLDLSKCTPMTLEIFNKWKAEKAQLREKEVETKRKEAEKTQKGSGMSIMSGRDLFKFDPSLFVDDDEADGRKQHIQICRAKTVESTRYTRITLCISPRVLLFFSSSVAFPCSL